LAVLAFDGKYVFRMVVKEGGLLEVKDLLAWSGEINGKFFE
jgi:hypothetical protein